MQVQHFMYFTRLCTILTVWVYTPLQYQNLPTVWNCITPIGGRHQFTLRKQILVTVYSYLIPCRMPFNDIISSTVSLKWHTMLPYGDVPSNVTLSDTIPKCCLPVASSYGDMPSNVTLSDTIPNCCLPVTSSQDLVSIDIIPSTVTFQWHHPKTCLLVTSRYTPRIRSMRGYIFILSVNMCVYVCVNAL